MNIKNKTIIIYECPTINDYIFINRYIKKNISVYIIEPFGAYHHKKGIRFYPPHLSFYIEELIQKRKISILRADEINAKDIYQMSADRAVEVIESVFHEYRKEHKELFEFVSDSLKSPEAENVFKKNLCDSLAEFYSTNILLHRIDRLFSPEPVLIYLDMNIHTYLRLKTLLSECNQEVFDHPNVQFPQKYCKKGLYDNLRQGMFAVSRLFAQTAVSGLLGGFNFYSGKKKRNYPYGIAVVSPTRQLKDTQQRPDFIIDGEKIHTGDVVYFPITELTKEQKKHLEAIPGDIYYLPKPGRYFSNFTKWFKLLWLCLKKNFLQNAGEINTACNVFFQYFSWQGVLKRVELRHFITYCDFGVGHIGRNLALNQTGVQTWYFTDSMNMGCNYQGSHGRRGVRHPFWTYLYYDHFVTWDELLAQYFKGHPGTFKQAHVVGCLWGGHINKKDQIKNPAVDAIEKKSEGCFRLAVFDTTYSRNGITSYAEGIAFTRHLIQLADSLEDIYIILKEKKARNLHSVFDPVLGHELLSLYNRMDAHKRMTTCSNQIDSSALISISDMVVSFPFTSTTFEALSVNKPAVWHDPLNCYKDTPYAKVGGVMTHSYEELKAKVAEIKNMQINSYRNPIPANSPLMDPYRDGKAIDRFRELLCLSKESAQ